MLVGIDTYSFHRYFGEIRQGEQDPGVRWSTWDFLERATGLGVDGVSLETCFLQLCKEEQRRRLAEYLDRTGWEKALAWGHPDGLQMGRSPSRLHELLRLIDQAAQMGIGLVRIVVGTYTHWQQEPVADSVERLAPVVKQACLQARNCGVELAVETHCALPVAGILELVERVGPDHLGVVLDSANVVRVGASLLEAARQLAPFTRMVHMKDLDMAQAEVGNPGGWWPCVGLGEGDLDLTGVIDILGSAGFAGMVCVEMATLATGSNEEQLVAEGVRWLRSALPRS